MIFLLSSFFFFKEITILTSDLRGFTNLSESQAPEDVVKILNYYLAAMELIISKHMGIIDEFMGDGILVLFGAPVSQKNDALNGEGYLLIKTI